MLLLTVWCKCTQSIYVCQQHIFSCWILVFGVLIKFICLCVFVFFLRIMTTTAAAEKRLKFVHKKQTNPLVQLNLMPFISFITMLFCCASLWSSSSLVHQVKFYWHHIERIGVDTQIGPDQAVSVKINFMM